MAFPKDTLRPELRRAIVRSWPDSRVTPLAGDASTRRFFRVAWDGTAGAAGSVILMDYGAPFVGMTDDVVMTGIFRAAGLPVPRVVGIHEDPGYLALEDLGDTMLETVLARAAATDVRIWLERAVDLAAAVAVKGTPVLERSARAVGPTLDRQRFRFEMDFFVEHYVRGLCGIAGTHDALRSELHALADAAAATPQRVLCHRDFHSRNLMVLEPDGRLAMVDIQDARWGPDSYDLASLLFDAYVDIDAGARSVLIRRYVAGLPTPPPGDFRRRFETVATERMVKALGTFGYQVAVRGNPRYRSAIPRTLERIDRIRPSLAGQFKDVFQNPM